jgi:hypothetical protein
MSLSVRSPINNYCSMTHHSSAFKERTSLADSIFGSITLMPRTMGFVAFLMPSVACAQVIVDFGASYPMSVKDLDNGDQLIVCRRPFGGSIVDSTYLETGIAGVDWDITPVVTERIAAAGNWSLISTLPTSDGLVLNGTLTSPGSSNASLVRLNNDGDVVWCNKYTSWSFPVALPSEDSIVAITNSGPTLHRITVGPDGTAMNSIAVSNTLNQSWSIYSGCATDSPSEHVIAGATYEGVPHAAIARIGPAGALWMNKYYVPIPGGVGYSRATSIVRAQEGGFTCIINAMDDQIPGISYYSYLVHLDEEGNVLWSRGSTITATAMSMGGLVQLETGDYLAIVYYDLLAPEILRFSLTGDLISKSYCQSPCNLQSLHGFMGAPRPFRFIRSGQRLAELGTNWVPCGRSNSAFTAGPPSASVTRIALTPTPGTSPTITTVPIPLAERTPELSATTSCGTTVIPSVPSLSDRFRAYPVPSDGSVTLELGTGPTDKRPIELRDVHGRLVMQGAAPGALDISSLEPGIYDCTVNGTTQHLRLVKE